MSATLTMTTSQPATELGNTISTSSSTTKSVSPNKSAGCGLIKSSKGDLHLSTTDGRGDTRDIEVLVPSTYAPNNPLALTFFFHGRGGSEEDAKAVGLQNVSGATNTSIFAFPQGVNYGSHGVGWDDTCAGYDMVLFDHMVSAIEGAYCIDTKRVFVAGFSWGCDFVTALACCRGNSIRAVAAASCSDEFTDPANYTTYANYPCPTTHAAGIRFTHDASAMGDGPYSGVQFASTRRLYQALNGCSANATSTAPAPCVSYQNCTQPLIECAYEGLGHGLPSAFAADTWAFFSSFR